MKTETTSPKTSVSLRIDSELVETIKSEAERSGSSVNNFLETLLENRFLKKNKYQIMKEAEREYMDKVGAAVQAPVEYLITNGNDWISIDNIEDFPIDDEDYVFQCSVNDGNVYLKIITQF